MLAPAPQRMPVSPIRLARVYDRAPHPIGAVFLVERLWPRGVRTGTLRLDGWLRDVAPSQELRTWFSHDPVRWQEFRRRYFAELDAHPAAWQPLVDAARDGEVTLLYSSRDREHNNAVALRDYLLSHLPTAERTPDEQDVARGSDPPAAGAGPRFRRGTQRPHGLRRA